MNEGHERFRVLSRPKMDAVHLVAVMCICGYISPPGPQDWCEKQWRNHKRDKEAA